MSEKNSISGGRVLRSSVGVFLGFLVVLGVLAYATLGGWAFPRAPHKRTPESKQLGEAIEGLASNSKELDARLGEIRLRGTSLGIWLVLADGEVKPVADTPEKCPVIVPALVWEGKDSVLITPDGVFQFFPHRRDNGDVWAVAVHWVLPTLKTRTGKLLRLLRLAIYTCLGLLGAWLTTRFLREKLDRPLERLRASLNLFGPEALDHRLEHSPEEWDELYSAFNDMARRLEASQAEVVSAKERAEEAERIRREFLADVSHCLGTPLCIVQTWLGVLEYEDESDPEEKTQLVRKVNREIQRLSRLVHHLLQLSRWEHTEPEMRITSFELSEPLIEVLEMLEIALLENNTRVNLDQLGSSRVEGDKIWIREIFQVFLENAIAHAGTGAEVTFTQVQTDDRVLVTVKDDGNGIPAEQLPLLKTRFSVRSSSSGLGVAVASKLIERHGGSLTIESEPGDGVTLTFDLPRPQS